MPKMSLEFTFTDIEIPCILKDENLDDTSAGFYHILVLFPQTDVYKGNGQLRESKCTV